MKHLWLFLFYLTVVCLPLLGVVAVADEPESASDSKPATITIAGTFQAVRSDEISVDAQHVASWEIKRIVDHGSRVRKGQNVVWFETEEIDKQIRDAESQLRLSQLSLQDDEFAYEQFLESQQLDRQAARRTREAAQQEFDNFVQVDRDRQVVSAEFNLKSSEAALENVMEELQQLEQMYNEDELTEESEEIVLKRAQQAVEAAQFRLEGTEIQSTRSIEQQIPRTQAEQESTLARAELAYRKTIHDLDTARKRREVELQQKRDKFKQEQQKLAEQKQERKQSVLTAPIDGIVLHGQLNRGKLGDKPSSMESGSKVTPDQVIATVVDPSKLQIRVDLDEKYLHVITEGTACIVKPSGFPEMQMTGKVASVSQLPYASGKFDCLVTFRSGPDAEQLMPTMGCQLEFEQPASEPNADDQKSDDKKSDDKKSDDTKSDDQKFDDSKKD